MAMNPEIGTSVCFKAAVLFNIEFSPTGESSGVCETEVQDM